ncbi:MAG: hypothetical protein ACXVCY_12975 [Pseudobdellovibrionaceae bacterium]
MTVKKPQKHERVSLLTLLLFVGAAGLTFAYFSLDESKSKLMMKEGPTAKTEKYEKSVNKHLMLTNEKMKLETQKVSLENAQLLNKDLASIPTQQAYENDNKLDLSTDSRAAEMANELGRGIRFEEISSPGDIIQKELFSQDQMQEYSQAYKQEYARQFIENARRGGYKVILSEDLSKIISVIPIRSPTQNNMELMPGSGAVH